MFHSGRFTALLDANVLYPAPVRDFLLHLANVDLYKPKWSNRIQDEWITSLLRNRPDLAKEALEKTKAAMNSAFPDATVEGYEKLIPAIKIPDENDRHVVAAAIRGKSDVIVTSNLRDFPRKKIATYDIEVQSPDEFISTLINLDREKGKKALDNLLRSLKNPPRTKQEVLQTRGDASLTQSIHLLKEI